MAKIRNGEGGAGDISPEDGESAYKYSSASDVKYPSKRKTNRNGSEKKYKCLEQNCGKEYIRAKHLKRHQLNHNPTQVYNCDFQGCSRTFPRRDSLNSHRHCHAAKWSQQNRKDSMLRHRSTPPEAMESSLPVLESTNKTRYQSPQQMYQNPPFQQLSHPLPISSYPPTSSSDPLRAWKQIYPAYKSTETANEGIEYQQSGPDMMLQVTTPGMQPVFTGEDCNRSPFTIPEDFGKNPICTHSLDINSDLVSGYLFADEHNHHKQPKGACERCRRQKIKCSGAKTNDWPCYACTRLNHHCVSPSVNHNDRDFASDPQTYEPQGLSYENRESGDDEYHQRQMADSYKIISPTYTQQVACPDPEIKTIEDYHSQCDDSNYNTVQTELSVNDQYQHWQDVLSLQKRHSLHLNSLKTCEQGQYGQQNLVDLLGELKINEAGTAPYLNYKSRIKSVIEEPAFEDLDEYEHALPASLSGPDLKVRIPPELMPDDKTALHLFDIYFIHAHPYVPVINKALFYQQWHTNREAISPLILEAIFAIAGRLADEPAQARQWLALVSKHADSFMDVPRLSTLQAMLIVLKARDSTPKRGYYFRSWMTVVLCVQMAKDLGLHEHLEEHKAGRPCGSDPADCVIKTRIWQTIFVCELMIGSPQGRTDLSVDIESVDLSMPRPSMEGDEGEIYNTRNFIYFSQVVRNVRRMNNVYSRIKTKREWGIDPDFVQLNLYFELWINDIPADLQITFPPDGSPPLLPSHFIGNLHSYYYLGIIMLHRPQLTFMEPTNIDGHWKRHMMICYWSAKSLCRLQEAIIQSFGMTGLLCMQRGIDFTLYCVLTCTVLHLVVLNSPDPDLNSDAREYFTRHMRILEKCSSSWPMPDIQQQIDVLRGVFSADMSKPFILKPTFPYGSLGAPTNTTPPRLNMEGMDSKSDSLTIQPNDQRSLQPSVMSWTPIPDQHTPRIFE